MAFDFYRFAAIRKASVVGLGLVRKQIDELNVVAFAIGKLTQPAGACLLYTSPSPRNA